MRLLREVGFSPGGLLDSLVRYWWLVLVLAALGIAGAFGFSAVSETVVPARAQVVLDGIRIPGLDSSNGGVAARSRVSDESLRMTSNPVLQIAADELGISVGELRRSVESRPAELATAVVIDGRMSTAAASAERVNAVVDAYVTNVRQDRAERTEELIAAIDELIATETVTLDQASADLAEIDARINATAQAESSSVGATQTLIRQLQSNSVERSEVVVEQRNARNQITFWNRRQVELTTELELFGNGIDFIRRAQGASGPPEPNLRRNALLGGVLGAVLGIALGWSINGNRVQATAIDRSSATPATPPEPFVDLTASNQPAVQPEPEYAPPQYAEPANLVAEPEYAQPAYAPPEHVQPEYVQPDNAVAEPEYAVAEPEHAQPEYPQPQHVDPAPVEYAAPQHTDQWEE